MDSVITGQNVQDIPMKKTNNVWSASIIPSDSRLNFCFYDGANNWDNNNGHSIGGLTVHNGKTNINYSLLLL